ncbi:hypothetical protein ACHAXR_006118 [Thalassiosira sp. AJA248-18]
MTSKIDVDPLLVALFDLPAGVQVGSSSKNAGQLKAIEIGTTPSSGRRGNSGRRSNSTDDGVETDTSLLHGESISLTDEEYSDAVAHVSPNVDRPPTFTTFRPNMVPLPVRPRGILGPPITERNCPEEFFERGGGRRSPPMGINTQHHAPSTAESRSTKQNSPKRKKKRRSSAIKSSLKKLVGRKSKSSSNVLNISSSFDEADSVISSPATDPSSYLCDNEQSPNTPQNIVDESLSLDRLSNLKSKIGRIRSTIHSLEGDLIATRNELARAHQHMHLATMELADIQRAALEADIGLSKIAHHHGGISISPSTSGRMSPLHFFEADMSMRSSIRSSSSDRLHYFTPTSSMLESGEDSDCFTPRSRLSSHDSFLSLSERDNINTPILDEASNAGDKDKTPLTRNSKAKYRRRFKFDSGAKSNTLTYGMDSNKESNSVSTPTTAASSTQEEEVPMSEVNGKAEEAVGDQKGRRVTFCRLQSFIRAHDLALNNESDDNSLLPLHETDANVSNVVNALFDRGFELAMDESDRWSPESSTGKILSKRTKKLSNGESNGLMGQWPNAASADEVLVWTCKCPHDGHGSEYPVVKARGLIPTSAKDMVDLLLDSGRVKQYNKMSLGRTDEHCFAKGAVDKFTKCSVTGIQGEAKIVLSKSQPPVIRKPVELRLLLHARRLPSESEEGEKYLTIGRSVWETERGTAEAEDNSATRCEMLLSVNLVRDLQVSGEQWCEITTITHGVSPGIPISIGKRIGLAAAAKYVRDIRAVFEKQNM